MQEGWMGAKISPLLNMSSAACPRVVARHGTTSGFLFSQISPLSRIALCGKLFFFNKNKILMMTSSCPNIAVAAEDASNQAGKLK